MSEDHGATAPVFIGGCGRSGTTLVVDMLGCHDALSPVYETACVVRVAKILFVGGARLSAAEKRRRVVRSVSEWSQDLPHLPHHKKDYERYRHGPHYVLFDRAFAMGEAEALARAIGAGDDIAAFRRFVLALLDEHARRDGKPRWINKMGPYVLILPVLWRAFPEMRFIHCVRDPRDVALSLLSRRWGPKDIDRAALQWLKCVAAGTAFGDRHPGACFEVRYEDLLAQPKAVLARIFAWLGVEDRSQEVHAKYADGFALDPGRAGTWRAGASAADVASIEGIARPLMGRFGYAPAHQ